jgi:hypothetical protein
VTLYEVARRAIDVADPTGADERLGALLERFEDADEPVTAVQNLGERVAIALEGVDVEIEDPAVSVAAATILYLAHRRDELDEDPAELLRLAARAEFHSKPPQHVERWLVAQGIEV